MALHVSYRVATAIDAPAMLTSHGTDPADTRVAANLDGQHDPQQALHSRIAYVASLTSA